MLAKIRFDYEICTATECYNLDPMDDKPCCSYLHWDAGVSWEEWQIESGLNAIGDVLYKPEAASNTCTCGQLIDVMDELALSGDRGNQNRLIEQLSAASASRCPKPLSVTEFFKLAAACGLGTEALTPAWGPMIDELIAHAGASRGITGPGPGTGTSAGRPGQGGATSGGENFNVPPYTNKP